jgi:D-inositol-3-phosphate glycosyltransferase
VDDGVSGLLVHGRDPADYAAAIRRVLARRELLAAGARRHASRFSWDRTVDSLVDAYAAAMAEMAAGTGQLLLPARERAARDAVRLVPGGTAVR